MIALIIALWETPYRFKSTSDISTRSLSALMMIHHRGMIGRRPPNKIEGPLEVYPFPRICIYIYIELINVAILINFNHY